VSTNHTMKIEDGHAMNIKSWSPEDRPREKLLLKGTSALSDAELIAILLGSGTANLSAVEVAKKVLAHVANNLDSLAKLSVKELMKTRGIGEAKAITIVAALELGRRRKEQSPDEKPKIEGSRTAVDLIKGDLMDLPHEEFWVMLLNRANRIIRKKRISEGGVSGTVADPKIIFKLAVDELASGIIVVHNHPSGNLKPSESDINLTRKIKEAGKVLEIALLDHLIIAHDRYFSFADEGLL
jgi:DNA repair protein RadC